MEILSKPCGDFMTNCYILKGKSGEIVIDPGQGSFAWIKQNTKKILAVLNTHGHFDHTFDDENLQILGHKIYIHEKDAFFLEKDPFGYLANCVTPDILIKDENEFFLGENDEFKVKFLHFPGHTPGSCMIKINGIIFSGDVLFKGSIGRYDFPYSNADDMKNSLLKILQIKKNFEIYPGHGQKSNLNDERKTIEYFLRFFR